MSNPQVVTIDTIRTVAFGGISGTYAAVGTSLTIPARIVCITNNTDGDMFFSTDGSNNMLFIKAGSFKLFDLNTNRNNRDQMFVFPIGTQFYVKQSTAATQGAVYVEVLGGPAA